MLLHRKNDRRDASSRSLTRWIVPGLNAPSSSTRNTNVGLARMRRIADLNAGVEAPLLASGRIELEHAGELRLRHRTTERAAGQRRENLRRASRLPGCAPPGGTRRCARGSACAGASRVERPGDRQRLDVRPAGGIVGAGGTAQERPQPLRARADLADEGRADRVRTRGHRHTDLQTRVDRVRPIGDHLTRPALLGLAANRGEEHARAVNRDLDLMRVLETANRLEVRAIEREREVILGVLREVVRDDQAADRSRAAALRCADPASGPA